MSDLIDRQKALDVLEMALTEDWEFGYAKDRMCELPSAQPEIIRCKDCICGHCDVWLSGNGEAEAYGYCGRTQLRVLSYDFCSWAKRRTECD